MGVFAHDFAGVNLLNITAIEDAVPATTGSVKSKLFTSKFFEFFYRS